MSTACSKEEPGAGGTSTVGAPAPVAPPAGTATVSGRVVYQGEPPQAPPIHMSADPYCAKANEGAPAQTFVRIGDAGALADVFVYVAKGLEAYRYTAPADRVVLDQRDCAYAPKVFGLQVGQPLEIRNSDETLHNVHALAEKSEGFNIGMPHKGMSAVRKFSIPEVLVRIKCDVHPWMSAFAGVVAHPFYAVTGADGAYELRGLPAGDYTIAAVHYELGDHVESITLGNGVAKTVDFTFSD